jgi:hypothetical protein
MLEGVDLSYSNKRTKGWPDFIIAKANEGTAKDPRRGQHSVYSTTTPVRSSGLGG